MEPQPRSCGDPYRAAGAGRDRLAAMKPQPEGCGGLLADLTITLNGVLPQWSRSPKAAES
jgi:hypothetical protein